MAKTRKLTIKEKAFRFTQGINKIQKEFPGDIKKQSFEASKLFRKLERKRVKKR